MATPTLPTSKFTFPQLFAPPSGLTVDEMDLGERLTQNANYTNEGTDKLKSLLMFLGMFEEVELVDNE